MNRSRKLILLVGVLVVVSIAAFAALHMKERKEEIRTSGEVVLEVDPDTVESLSWEADSDPLSFHRDGGWVYDEDDAFPVDEEKIGELLGQFQSFGAAFVIENVEDPGQYGLDDPSCTIHMKTADREYEILLGDFSSMDSQRYVSIGDGNVYLAATDPMDAFDATLREVIDNDETPDVDEVKTMEFGGVDSWKAERQEENTLTICGEDRYFTQQEGVTLPLDSGRVGTLLGDIASLDLTNYVTYKVTEEELATYGLDHPERTITLTYSTEGEDGQETEETFTLAVSRDPDEQASAGEESGGDTSQQSDSSGETEDTEEINAFVRVGDSPIVYQVTGVDYVALMDSSFDDLRHREMFSGDTEEITSIDVTLEGSSYTITPEGSGEDRTWKYGEEETEADDLTQALTGLTADTFTTEKPTQKEEIALTIHLDNDNADQLSLTLYRYDGSRCLCQADGRSVCLVPRSQAVSLIEAVNAIVLNAA